MRAEYAPTDPHKGAAQPLVTIVEFSDFECPFCSKLATSLESVAARYPDDVRLVFKQFPLADARARRACCSCGRGRARAGQVLGDARQAVRGPREVGRCGHPRPRAGDRARHGEVREGPRRSGDAGEGRGGDERGARARGGIDADVLRQRPQGDGREGSRCDRADRRRRARAREPDPRRRREARRDLRPHHASGRCGQGRGEGGRSHPQAR